jgi:prepilin-type N-terminal cleavage/methylation domain-containing protein
MKNRSGFSLIEVIIAFSILTITLVAATSLVSSSIQNNQENILRVQAYFLAQEGIELARGYRDSLWLKGENIDNLNNISYLEFPVINGPITNALSPAGDLYLNQEPTQLGFSYSPNDSEPKFKRTIKLQQIDPDDLDKKNSQIPSSYKNENFSPTTFSRKVTSIVSYEFNNQTKQIQLTTVLSDWKQAAQ